MRMRSYAEIKARLERYQQNEPMVRDKTGKMNLNYMMAELLWVLGEEGK